MGTDIRPEVTTKNNYWISKHRYYELKHFCLQYIEWKAEYSELDGMEGGDMIRETKSTNISNPVERRMTNATITSRRACVERIEILPDGTIPQVEMTSLGFDSYRTEDWEVLFAFFDIFQKFRYLSI